MTPIHRETEVFFEFGNVEIRTSNFSVENIDRSGGKMNVQLYVQPTVCKPSLQNAGGCC